MKKECYSCSKMTRYSDLTTIKGISLCRNCVNEEGDDVFVVKCDSETLESESQPLPLYLGGSEAEQESSLDLDFLNDAQKLNVDDDNVAPLDQTEDKKEEAKKEDKKEAKKESKKEDKQKTKKKATKKEDKKKNKKEAKETKKESNVDTMEEVEVDKSKKRKAEEEPEHTEKKKKVKLIDGNEGDNFFSEEDFKEFNNDLIASLQWRGECKLIQSEKIFNDLIVQVIAQEDVEKYHELKLLTWLRLNFTQVCDVEYFVNQFQILKKQTSKADCDALFDSMVKYLARYVVITRQDELTLWMLKDINNNLVWFPYDLERIRKKFSKTSAKIIFEIENKEKKKKTLSAPVQYSLIDALLTHDWRITASFISADSTKPLMYIEKFQNKDHLYFNTAISRRYTNKEIIKKVETDVSKEKIEEAHQIWEEILNESLCKNDEVSKKTLIYWCTRHFIEEPKERTRASIMVTGLSGTGKSSFFEWTFKTAFGGAYVKREAPTLGLGFMEELIGKQVVFLDEVKINSAHDYNVIKNLVTSDTTVLRAMYKSAATVPWNGEIIMVANDRYPIKFESQDERRFKKIITSDRKKGPKFSTFWEKVKSLAELAGGLLWAYFLVKPLEDPKYKEEVRTFNFDNIQLKANLETAYDKLPLIAKFIILMYTDPDGDIGSWYTKEGRKEPKQNIFAKFEQFQDEFSVTDKQKMKFEQFVREMEDLIFDPKQKIDGRNPRNYLILFDKERIRENFMRRFGGVDPKPEDE
uniref:NrS-1 polymerase-like helicase domain-containing protein n=1 Tax=Arcella intermedia TaxID=1963864 RepID=A0A6B2KYD4_9EUKA